MTDLVNRLREHLDINFNHEAGLIPISTQFKVAEAADRIEELERANAVLQGKYDQAKTDRDTGMVKHIKEYADIADQLDAEKALADQLYEAARNYRVSAFNARDKSFMDAHAAYRKTRGL